MISVNVKHGLAIAVLAASLLVLPGEAEADMSERAVAECVLDNMKGVNDKSAAGLVYQACDTLYGTHRCQFDWSKFTDEERKTAEAAHKSGDYSKINYEFLARIVNEEDRVDDPKCRVPNS